VVADENANRDSRLGWVFLGGGFGTNDPVTSRASPGGDTSETRTFGKGHLRMQLRSSLEWTMLRVKPKDGGTACFRVVTQTGGGWGEVKQGAPNEIKEKSVGEGSPQLGLGGESEKKGIKESFLNL